MRTDTHLVEDTLIAYYRDVHDHALRALETLDAARERLSSTLQAHLNEQGAQLNEITKKLAAWGSHHRGAHCHHRLLRPEMRHTPASATFQDS